MVRVKVWVSANQSPRPSMGLWYTPPSLTVSLSLSPLVCPLHERHLLARHVTKDLWDCVLDAIPSLRQDLTLTPPHCCILEGSRWHLVGIYVPLSPSLDGWC